MAREREVPSRALKQDPARIKAPMGGKPGEKAAGSVSWALSFRFCSFFCHSPTLLCNMSLSNKFCILYTANNQTGRDLYISGLIWHLLTHRASRDGSVMPDLPSIPRLLTIAGGGKGGLISLLILGFDLAISKLPVLYYVI